MLSDISWTPYGLDDVDHDVDVAAGRLGIGARRMSFLDERLCGFTVETGQADVQPRAEEIPLSPWFRSTSASIVGSAGSLIRRRRAARAIAPSKHADQPAAKSCSGLVPARPEPGVDNL